MSDTTMKFVMVIKRGPTEIAKIDGQLQLLSTEPGDDAQVVKSMFEMEQLLNLHTAEYRFHISLSEPTGAPTAANPK